MGNAIMDYGQSLISFSRKNLSQSKNTADFISPLNGAIDTYQKYLNREIDIANENMSLDNLRNSPENIKNCDGDAFLGLSINSDRAYIELWSALDSELKIADDFMYKNGYTYNRIDNPSNWIHTRKFFNYLRANIDSITSEIPMSISIRSNLREILNAGIRFWHDIEETNMPKFEIQYDKENYELSLEN